MKRLVLLSVIVSSLLLLTSCYMMSVRPTGTISLNLGGPAGRAIDPTAQVRVYLYAYSSASAYGLYTFPSGKQYAEFSYGSGTQTLTGIPIGLWKVLVSTGQDGPNDSFAVALYGASSVVSVTAGIDTSASITTAPSVNIINSTALLGKALNGVLFDYYSSNNLYVSSTDALYSLQYGDITASPAPISLPSGLQIRSMTDGATFGTGTAVRSVFLNSDQGIVPYGVPATGGPAVFNLSFSKTLFDGTGNPDTVLDSGYVNFIDRNSQQGMAVFFSDNRGLGGVYLCVMSNDFYPSDGSKGAPWVAIDLETAVDRPIYALAPDSISTGQTGLPLMGYTYFATKAGAFRTGPSIVDSTDPTSGTLNSVVRFNAPGNATIQAIAVDDYDGLIYIGTPHGAYWAYLDEKSSNVISGSWNLIAETAGDNIVSIKVDAPDGYYYFSGAVALRSRYNLYTIDAPEPYGTVAAYPFYAGLPGEITAMDFANGSLFVTGTKGLVRVFVLRAPS